MNIYLYIYLNIQGSLNKFPDFFHMGTFIDSTHMKVSLSLSLYIYIYIYIYRVTPPKKTEPILLR